MNHESLLFYGCMFPKGKSEEIIRHSYSSVQMASHNFQWSLIDGFLANNEVKTTLLSTMAVGSFPRGYDQPWVRMQEIVSSKDVAETYLGFINLTVIKHFLRPFSEKKALSAWLRNSKDTTRFVFLYSYSHFYHPVIRYLRKQDPQIIICISINDLPQYTSNNKKGRSFLGSLWKWYRIERIKKTRKYIDAFMVVSDEIAYHEQIPDNRWVRVEAIITQNEIANPRLSKLSYPVDGEYKVICYTGGLLVEYGIDVLLKAFEIITSAEYRLVICGDGPLKYEVIKASERDKRIIYYGTVSSQVAKIIQQNATVLVNPRQAGQDFTRYSFPIKTADYMLVGKPVIGYRLEAIPSEYDNHIIYVDSDTIDALSSKIIKVCELDLSTRLQIGNQNREFVLTKKNAEVQSAKILDMMRRFAHEKRGSSIKTVW